ncbi:hypothetical protein HOLleu_34890 [Holothuria leucospilota]|uniref:Uncharacterized protein n=1 Tax=Holothuria leucospilota TaxID=206669 RepID=A0A9Q1BHF4_HOLLE|nr:hypothetical protein HOLleu_34890 [Holothuria leucospilota]
MGAPVVCERSCGYGCTQQHVLDRTRYSRRELRSRTSFLAHAELPRTAKEARVSMGAPVVCERSCGYGCTQQHVLNRTRYSRRELRSRTSFLAHAELETGVAARKFRRCNEKSRAAARACLGKLPAFQTRTSAGSVGGQPG